jgi:hypothetical protein
MCLACDRPIEESLAPLGSLRCLACREANAFLDPVLFTRWEAASRASGGRGAPRMR